ncbi:MAG: acetylornithine transaminase, partial [Propionibacteriales bacterium]|nr:acetylornithine transaminase [Propionibacteriales bacterium]
AVTEQLRTLGHVSNFFTSGPQVALAEKLVELLHGGRAASAEDGGRAASASERSVETRSVETPGKVFFTNSGTEANEAALKLTRRTGRTHLVAAEGAFHGRTMGALALTAKAAYREPFEPLPGHVTFVPYGDAAALEAAVTDETAAVILEPIQGEAGVVVPPRDYLARAREITSAKGALLWLDEIQTGMGRTGAWFAHQNPDVCDPLPSPADVVTVAKGLAGGFPIGACIAIGEAADLLQPGNHGTTFGGNPVACAAALAVIETIEADGLLERATALGRRIRDEVAADPRVAEATGSGLLVGIVLHDRGAIRLAEAALAHGFIVNPATVERIRLAPPLVLTDDDADAFVKAFPTWLDEVL